MQGGKVELLFDAGFWVKTLSISSDLILAGLGNGEIYALSHHGNLLWDWNMEKEIKIVEITSYSVTVACKNTLSLFSSDGELIWERRFKNSVSSMLVISGKIVLGFNDGSICIFNEEAEVALKLARHVDELAATSGKLIAVTRDFIGAKVHMLDLDGNVVWTRNIGKSIGSALLSASLTNIAVGTQNVYLLSTGGRF